MSVCHRTVGWKGGVRVAFEFLTDLCMKKVRALFCQVQACLTLFLRCPDKLASTIRIHDASGFHLWYKVQRVARLGAATQKRRVVQPMHSVRRNH